jgi:phospholipase/lecithinase/hemolysin
MVVLFRHAFSLDLSLQLSGRNSAAGFSLIHYVRQEAVMKHTDRGWLCGRLVGALGLAVLAACGGGGNGGDQSLKFQPSRIVSFGDSLSDVGSYRTAGMVGSVNTKNDFPLTEVTHTGKFTVNSPDAKNWIELLAAQLGVAAPCPAQTGLTPPTGSPLAGAGAVPADHAECFAYGQGGSRVTNPVGPGNALLGLANGAPGQLTTPLVAQVAKHLAKGTGGAGKFAGDELVLVLAGGNDLFINAAAFAATVGAGGNAADAGTAAMAAMTTAGNELATLVKTQMVAKGATHVVVVNLPDVSLTPAFQGSTAETLAFDMTEAFNHALADGLADAGPAVLLVDAFTQSQDQFAHPAQYGLSNVTTPACVKDTTVILYDSALVCNTKTVVAGDVSSFHYADDVHPTPYGHRLLAQFVAGRMARAGLL